MMVVILIIATLICQSCARWEITIDYLNQVVAPITAAVLDAVTLWEQINITSNTC